VIPVAAGGAAIAQQIMAMLPPLIWDDLTSLAEGQGDEKRLTPGEIKKLKDSDVDIHDLKEGMGPGKDLFKDRDGNIIIKRKDGKGEGEPTGLNIKNF